MKIIEKLKLYCKKAEPYIPDAFYAATVISLVYAALSAILRLIITPGFMKVQAFFANLIGGILFSFGVLICAILIEKVFAIHTLLKDIMQKENKN